jgi:D-alanyl-D-alanine carboxypeptidase/D-alanyl-D-alanine-endopeptidase (penicillin-binding protein 4)
MVADAVRASGAIDPLPEGGVLVVESVAAERASAVGARSCMIARDVDDSGVMPDVFVCPRRCVVLWFARRVGVMLVCVLLAGPAWATLLNPPAERAIQSADLRDTVAAVLVRDLDRDDTLIDINSRTLLIPASNAKLATTVAALDLLGPDFRFRTRLGITPPEPDSPAAAPPPDLVITADGDPGFGDPDLLAQNGLQLEDLLDQWVAAVRNAEPDRIGRLVLDDAIFDRQYTHPQWEPDDLLRPYGAQVAAMNFYANILDILPVPNAQFGATPKVSVFPASSLIDTANRARTGSSDHFLVHRELGTNHLRFSGTVKSRPRTPLRITVHDPGLHFATMFAERLAQEGIPVGQVVRRDADDPHVPSIDLHVVQTALPLVLQQVNQDSNNLAAAAVFKRYGHAFTGSPGSWDNAAAATNHALGLRLGAAFANARVTDGSGLARSNLLSARLLVDLLDLAHRDPALAEPLRASLAYAGTNAQGTHLADGTLRRRFRQLPPGHWVLAKSGYLSGVSALSGYLVATDPQAAAEPRVIAFAMIFNGFRPPVYNSHLKAVQEEILMLVDEHVTATTPALGG